MEQNRFSNEMPEEVILIPNPRTIRINHARPERAYGLFDTETGVQVSNFVNSNNEQIEFANLNPDRHYDVGVIEDMGDDKPTFAIAWNWKMRDDTEEILKNSNDLPVVYPARYTIRFKDDSSNGVYDLIDSNGDTVGQVAQLSPQGDKPYFRYITSMRMKDDTIE